MTTKREALEATPIIEADQFNLIETIHADMKKDFAELRLRDDSVTDFCPSGNASIDLVASDKIGNGGWAFGRIIEMYGDESTGKSMLANLCLINTIHRLGGIGFLMDTENGFTPAFYRMLGGDPDALLIHNPKHIDEAWAFVLKAIEKVEVLRKKTGKNIPFAIVYDSLAGSPTVEEYEKGMGTVDYGKRGKAHYQGCRLAVDRIRESNALLFVVNQLRATMAQFGPEQDSVGGKAMKYFASLRCHLKRSKRLYESTSGEVAIKTQSGAKASDRFVGMRCKFQVEKTRFTVPFREVEFDLYFRGGVSPFSGWYGVLKDHWVDEFGKNRITGAPAKTDPTKVRPGYYMIDGDTDNSFTEKTFMEYLVKNRPDLLAGYKYDEEAAELLGKEESVQAVDISPEEQEEAEKLRQEGWDDESEESDASAADKV